MNNLVIFGAQWGDEGKGRFVDELARHANAVVRFQGGNNAGHTVMANGQTFKLQLIPSGILYPDVKNIIANGVVVDVEGLLGEISALQARGVDCKNLFVSERAHVVFDFHKRIDRLNEEMLGVKKVGTTLKGIGPAYMDKIERSGIRICDLINKKLFPELLEALVARKNILFKNYYGVPQINFHEILAKYTTLAEQISPYVVNTIELVHTLAKQNRKVLFEGAQGAMLDIDFGTYPFVTSSHPSSVGVSSGTGLSPSSISKVLGVVKAYNSRVGSGPFPTELFDEVGSFLRDKGMEYGTVTGRPRRIGWLDMVVVRYSATISGMTHIALSRMDTLAGVDTVKICTGYSLDGQITNSLPASVEALERCVPVYKEFDGWDDSISKIRDYNSLPQSAKAYIRAIEEAAGSEVSMIGVGPNRDEVIFRNRIF